MSITVYNQSQPALKKLEFRLSGKEPALFIQIWSTALLPVHAKLANLSVKLATANTIKLKADRLSETARLIKSAGAIVNSDRDNLIEFNCPRTCKGYVWLDKVRFMGSVEYSLAKSEYFNNIYLPLSKLSSDIEFTHIDFQLWPDETGLERI